ncbi:MAG: hypothetical protein PHO92_05330, partial [Candidatus Peribacteraceae bacterium]|nr:hypothetical protein [Candidatus Peribacteraceae bacterium]
MKKTCAQCSAPFEITDADLKFYEKVSPTFNGKKELIPPPTLCPECRQQRRLTYRNERKLYPAVCGSCKKEMVSLYHAPSPYNVLCTECWWSDTWDGLSFGRDMDFSQPFFPQFAALQREVPRLAIFHLNSENSTFTNHSANNKNCYMGVAFGACEDCQYGHWVLKSNDSVDCTYVEESERCYEGTYLQHCFETLFCERCQHCRKCMLCFDCRNCEHCIACTLQQHARYQILNEPVSESEFVRTWEELLHSQERFDAMRHAYEELKRKTPRRPTLQIQCFDSSGDDLYQCQNMHRCFNCREMKDCSYTYDAATLKDCMDSYEHGWLVPAELIYETHAGMAGFRFLFCHICSYSRDLIYCDCCNNETEHLFGCISLKRKQYCILNKQYTKEEYNRLVPKIIEHMRKTGEWGEFFPTAFSPFAYNESVAQEYFPMTKAEVETRGWKWRDEKDEMQKAEKIIPAAKLPASIEDIPDDILNWAIKCETTGRPFRIIKQELAFY